LSGNRHTDRGNELEPEARAEFERITKLTVAQVGFVTRDDGIVGCSPDGLIVDEGTFPPSEFDFARYVAGLEIKCPTAAKHAKAVIEGAMPDEHKPQVHGSMAVTGLPHWFFMSYCQGMKPLLVRIDWDEYTDAMSDALDRFLIFYAERRRDIMPKLRREQA
jgi:hypothetical protein